MGPPDNVAPSALWAALQKMPRPKKIVDYPRVIDSGEPVGQLVMWPLSQNEQMAANGEADRFAKKLLKESQKKDEASLGYDSIYSNEVAVQVLFRACRDVDDPKKPAFPQANVLRDVSADEIGALFLLYCEVQAELGPMVSRLSEEEMKAWVEALAEGGRQAPFSLLSLDSQLRLVHFMASQIASYSTAKSSAGSQQETPQPSESDE